MPGLKFRVLLDTDKQEEIFRDVHISDTDNFESFFKAILNAFEFKGSEIGSFYVSNDDWDKGHEINLLDMSYDDDAIDDPANVMKDATIKNFIEEPDQKFILVYDFMRMWIFLIELIGFDIVSSPSTPGAYLFKESKQWGMKKLMDSDHKLLKTDDVKIKIKNLKNNLNNLSKDGFWN